MEISTWPLPLDKPLRHSVLRKSNTVEFDPSGNSQGTGDSLDVLAKRSSIPWLFFLMIAAFTGLGVRLFYLQTINGSNFLARAEQNRIRTQIIPAPRGSIVDRNNKQLVQNVPNFVLTIIPADVPTKTTERVKTLNRLSAISGLSSADIEQKISNTRLRRTDPVSLIDHASYQQATDWMINATDVPGLSVQALPTRSYPDGQASASILGYIGTISEDELAASPRASRLATTGKAGIEKIYNTELTGRDGQREVERDVFNAQQRVLTEREPEPGQTIQLAIDRDLENKLWESLNNTVNRLHSPGGAAIAMNPQNGEVLALVSAPTYDNNWFVTGDHQADVQKALTDPKKLLLNRAVSGSYPSGSIIKPLIGTAGLAENIVTPSTTVVSTGGFKVGVDSFPDWKAGGHGVTNLAKALAESVNTYFYILGGGYQGKAGLGVDRIVKYLQAFGWGSKVGIDLPSEVAGLVPTEHWRNTERTSPWKLGDTYHLAIGQGDLQVTPIQVATALSAIANGGTLYQPHLAKAILDPNGATLKTIQPKVMNNKIAPATDIQSVRAGMREGVLSGSSRSLQDLPVPSAGKTGTAQFGNAGKTHSWFSAFAPYDNPTIAIVVLVEAGGEGNAAALPVAHDVLKWYFTQNQPQ